MLPGEQVNPAPKNAEWSAPRDRGDAPSMPPPAMLPDMNALSRRTSFPPQMSPGIPDIMSPPGPAWGRPGETATEYDTRMHRGNLSDFFSVSLDVAPGFRGTGKTTRQIIGSPRGAVLLMRSQIDYYKRLCAKMGRDDIEVVRVDNCESWFLNHAPRPVVADHDVREIPGIVYHFHRAWERIRKDEDAPSHRADALQYAAVNTQIFGRVTRKKPADPNYGMKVRDDRPMSLREENAAYDVYKRAHAGEEKAKQVHRDTADYVGKQLLTKYDFSRFRP